MKMTGVDFLEIFFILMQIVIAILALNSRDLMIAVIAFAAFSFCSAGVFILMKAVDVGFVEVLIGVSVTLYFIAMFYKVERRSTP